MLSDPELGEAASAEREGELAGALAGRDGECLSGQASGCESRAHWAAVSSPFSLPFPFSESDVG